MSKAPLCLLALLPFLAGCAGVGVAGGADDAAAASAGPSDLTFGIHWVGGHDSQWAADRLRMVSRLPNVVPLPNERAAQDVDVIVRCTYMGNSIKIETFSSKSHSPLTEGSASWWTENAGFQGIGAHLNQHFGPDTELYAAAIAGREQQAAASGGGVSKSELEEIVKKAVAGASSKSEAAEAPASRRSDVDAPRYHAAERPDDYAVVIGIEKYSDLPSAAFAEHDAQAVRAHFAALGIPERNIVSLLGSKAGKAAFMKTFETWLPKNVGPDSTVWVYYSGHGAPDPRTGQAFLLPWDSDVQFLDDTAYPLKRLYSKLNALPAKRVVVALDSCFSGAGGRSVLAKGLRPLVAKVDAGVSGEKIVAFTASAAEQVSGTLDEEAHGLFTYHLLKGLNGAAADARGRVTLDGLYSYVSPKVADQARRQNREQRPQLLPRRENAASVLLR